MTHVLTVIGPAGGLDPSLLHALAGDARDAGARTAAPIWLAPGQAADLPFTADQPARIEQALRGRLAETGIDIAVQPVAGRRKMLLVADMDATILVGETLDELAAVAGIGEKVAAITARAMRGEIDFKGALRERVGMLKGLPTSAMAETLARIAYTTGAHALVRTMRAHGAYAVLVSGGFRYFTGRVREECGFDRDVSNELLIENDRLTGEVGEPIIDRGAKLATLRAVALERSIDSSLSLAVGDGANDLDMIQAAGLGVAFHAKPVVAAAAPVRIDHGDLTALLFLQGYRQEEFAR